MIFKCMNYWYWFCTIASFIKHEMYLYMNTIQYVHWKSNIFTLDKKKPKICDTHLQEKKQGFFLSMGAKFKENRHFIWVVLLCRYLICNVPPENSFSDWLWGLNQKMLMSATNQATVMACQIKKRGLSVCWIIKTKSIDSHSDLLYNILLVLTVRQF